MRAKLDKHIRVFFKMYRVYPEFGKAGRMLNNKPKSETPFFTLHIGPFWPSASRSQRSIHFNEIIVDQGLGVTKDKDGYVLP